jgi:hypothetical protein
MSCNFSLAEASSAIHVKKIPLGPRRGTQEKAKSALDLYDLALNDLELKFKSEKGVRIDRRKKYIKKCLEPLVHMAL